MNVFTTYISLLHKYLPYVAVCQKKTGGIWVEKKWTRSRSRKNTPDLAWTGLWTVYVHVDDCTIAATSIFLIKNFKSEIAKHVEIMDLGELHWLRGIEIKWNRENRTIHLSQCSYIEAILCRFNFQVNWPRSGPVQVRPLWCRTWTRTLGSGSGQGWTRT